MKISIKTVFLPIIISIVLLVSVGCNPFDNGSNAYLEKYMTAIPIEFDGYELCSGSLDEFNGEVTINDTTVIINSRASGYNGSYSITVNGKEIFINDEFMREKSEAYVYIHDVWLDFKTAKEYHRQHHGVSSIYGVYAFDNNLFIITSGLFDRLTMKINVFGVYPITLYKYDIATGRVLYCGYYNHYDKGTDERVEIRVKESV